MTCLWNACSVQVTSFDISEFNAMVSDHRWILSYLKAQAPLLNFAHRAKHKSKDDAYKDEDYDECKPDEDSDEDYDECKSV